MLILRKLLDAHGPGHQIGKHIQRTTRRKRMMGLSGDRYEQSEET